MSRPTLQLADPNYFLSAGNNSYLSAPNMMLSADADDIYVKVPTEHGIIKVREDMFDTLDPMTYDAVMEYLIPYNDPNAQMMNGLLSKWKDKKNQRKIDRINARAAGRANVASQGGGFGNAVGNIVDKLGNVASTIFGGGAGGVDPNAQQRGLNVGGGLQFGTTPQIATPIYKQPWFWGILGALGIGAIVMSRRH